MKDLFMDDKMKGHAAGIFADWSVGGSSQSAADVQRIKDCPTARGRRQAAADRAAYREAIDIVKRYVSAAEDGHRPAKIIGIVQRDIVGNSRRQYRRRG